MNTLKGKFTIVKRKRWNERLMDAYDRGFHDGYAVRDAEWFDYEADMANMREERKEVGTL